MYRTQFGGPRPRQGQNSGGLPPQLAQLLQLAPLLLLILITFVSRSSPPAYSLQKSRDYAVPMHSDRYNVPYFVASARSFETEYPVNSQQRCDFGNLQICKDSCWCK